MDKYKSWEVPENNYKEAKSEQVNEYTQKESNRVLKNPHNGYSVFDDNPNLLKTGLHKRIVNQVIYLRFCEFLMNYN